ncbi:MAG: PrsW family intramembrane metalloprotease [Paludibacteraceae bacterium]|nr:PrsW family intramembrane metalloprotease [Paludibacteraceae bacterium]
MHSNLYVIIGAAILPAIAWVAFIWLKDKYQREPLKYILRGVAYGIISAGLAIALESLISGLGLTPEPQGYIGALWKAFIGAALPEEFVKLLMLWLLLRNNPYFDERFDGIVYACCVGMGFAGTENIIYLLGNIDTWETVAIQRAIFSIPGHFMFAVAMGYFYSMLHFGDMSWQKRSRIIWVPVALHTIYDGLLFMASLGTILTGLLVLAFYVFCYFMLRGGQRRIAEHLKRDKEDPNQVAYYADNK